MGEKVIGVGVDLVETDRIATLITRHGGRFVAKALTRTEVAGMGGRASHPMYVARRLAAKEAVMKAYGTGLRSGTSWHDIELDDRGMGRCTVRLLGPGRERDRVHMALSRQAGLVLAVAVLTRTEDPA